MVGPFGPDALASGVMQARTAEEIADGSNNANIGSVPLVASSANLNKVATTTNDPNGSAATAIVAQAATNPPARHTGAAPRRRARARGRCVPLK